MTEQPGTEQPLAALRSVAPTSPNGSESVSTSQAPAANTNPFQRLDGDPDHPSALGRAAVLHASPREVSVGVNNDAYGWVEVKTAMSGGHLSASLVTETATAQHAIRAEMPALQQFLVERSVSVANLAVGSQGSGSAGGEGQGSAGASSEQESSGARESTTEAPVAELEQSAWNSSRISVRV